ncbi:MAG: hypothetical protein ACREUT_08350 [Steroidobacteraceae bacterium]
MPRNSPRVWQIADAIERKRIVRLLIRDVALDQSRNRGLETMRITWQTGAVSEHQVPRRVRSYGVCESTPALQKRLRELAKGGKFDREIADILNAERVLPARVAAFRSNNVHRLRKRSGVRTRKINGVEDNPTRGPDGSYSAKGAAATLRITLQTILASPPNFEWRKISKVSILSYSWARWTMRTR